MDRTPAPKMHLRIAAVGDIHVSKASQGTFQSLFAQIFPHLGSSRLEEPINRYRVSAVFHGHAHRGTATARTATGVPVFNVAMPLLARLNPDRPPYLILELPLDGEHVTRPAAARLPRQSRPL